MIKILIVGGKLQGVEVAYLAKKAGYFSILVDKSKDIPASGLADRFMQEDVFSKEIMLELFEEVNVVLPAIENKEVLKKLLEYGEMTKTKVIYDEKNYNISSSKQLSNKLFEKLGLPLPAADSNISYPVIIKPDDLSGSSHVYKAFSKEEAKQISAALDGKIVIQEYLEGRSFSLEVIGDGENFFYPQITEVVIDESYDCKRIIAPAEISEEQEKQFFVIAEKLAKSLKIKGIFDIEVISHNGILKLLEIDARFPSQTPISVYQSSGINMVKILVELALGTFENMKKAKNEICYYQQIVVTNSSIQVIGEHAITECKHLVLVDGFFGAHEGITDYKEGSKNWKAIVIITADTYQKAYEKFLLCIENIKSELKNKKCIFLEG